MRDEVWIEAGKRMILRQFYIRESMRIFLMFVIAADAFVYGVHIKCKGNRKTVFHAGIRLNAGYQSHRVHDRNGA